MPSLYMYVIVMLILVVYVYMVYTWHSRCYAAHSTVTKLEILVI